MAHSFVPNPLHLFLVVSFFSSLSGFVGSWKEVEVVEGRRDSVGSKSLLASVAILVLGFFVLALQYAGDRYHPSRLFLTTALLSF